MWMNNRNTVILKRKQIQKNTDEEGMKNRFQSMKLFQAITKTDWDTLYKERHQQHIMKVTISSVKVKYPVKLINMIGDQPNALFHIVRGRVKFVREDTEEVISIHDESTGTFGELVF